MTDRDNNPNPIEKPVDITQFDGVADDKTKIASDSSAERGRNGQVGYDPDADREDPWTLAF